MGERLTFPNERDEGHPMPRTLPHRTGSNRPCRPQPATGAGQDPEHSDDPAT